MDSVEVVLVGAGVVGMAVARALAMQGREVVVIERHSRPGQETTSRNSGVIHSGIYYPTGSLKARLCTRGRELLYEYCAQRDIGHQRCGKLIVASDGQVPALRALQRKAIDNGVLDLELLEGEQVSALEPRVRCAAGLLSPSTGIVDVHELVMSLIADFEAHAGMLVYNTSLRQARVVDGGFELQFQGGDSESELACRWLVNCAGLDAVDLLRRIEGFPEAQRSPAFYAKGNYFSCQGLRPFSRLVYPMPNNAGLGVHATLELDGTTKFGPDVQWVPAPEYDVDPARAASFLEAIREYCPSLPDTALQPAYAGVRPKLVGPNDPPADFRIDTERQHGIRGLVNLLGIESPGLTSSLAIGEFVANGVN